MRADDAVSFKAAARERNTIRHIVPLAEMVLLTDAAEWRVGSVTGGPLAGNEPVSISPQSFVGAAGAQPAMVNSSVIFAANRGGHVRELAYSFNQNGYITGDLSLRAPHLFDGATILDMAYAKAPIPIVWCVSSTGGLLGLTYVPEQQVGAWHRHDTDGVFESIAVVAEGAEDVLYAVVQRTIGGNTVRYIERQATRANGAIADAFFVDAGSTYRGAAVSAVGGLTWLEGKTVAVLADGAVLAPRVVIGGSIALDAPAAVVTVGLPIIADMQTLPLVIEAQAYGQGRPKNVNSAWVRVFKSSGWAAGPAFDRLVDVKTRTTEAMGAPPLLQTDEVQTVLRGTWDDAGQLCVRQANPLPLTIVSLTLDVAIGG